MDQNTYAYSIELSLNTSKASDQLNAFLGSISNIEQKIMDMTKVATNNINTIIGSVVNDIQQLQNVTNSLQVKPTTDIDGEERIVELAGELQYELRDIKDLRSQIGEFQNNSLEVAVKEQKQLDEFVETFSTIHDTIDDKNKLHKVELDLVKDEKNVIDNMSNSWLNVADNVGNINGQYANTARSLRQISDLLMLIDEEANNFITTNYRIYGSQQDIAQQARKLVIEYGMLRQETIEAMEVLGNMRMPVNELERYAQSIAKANRYTGVSIPSLSSYASRMRQVEMSAINIERQLEFTSEAMRKFGLDTSDVNGILNNTTRSAMEFELMFRGDIQMEKYDQLRMVVAGLGKQFGMTAEDTNLLFNTLEDPSKRMLFEQFAGQAINSVEDLAVAINNSGKRAAIYIQQLERQNLSAIELQIELDAVSEAYGFGSTKAMLMAAKLSETADKMGLNIGNAQELNKILQQAQRDGIDPFSEANSTLSMQFEILRDRGAALISYVLQPLSDMLLVVLKTINSTIDVIIDFAKSINKVIKDVEQLIPGIDILFESFKYGTVMIIGLTGALIGVATSFGLLRNAISLIEQTIVRIFTSLGQGLLSLGNSIRTVVIPLMALGTAFLMVGASAYMFSQAVATIAEKGWSGVGALIALTVAIGTLGVALVTLGVMAEATMPGMLVLSAGLLAVGASAMMIGKGMQYAASAFETTAMAVEQLSSGIITKFVSEIVNASLTLPIAAIGLYSASSNLQDAFYAINEAVQSIGDVSAITQQYQQLVAVMTQFTQSIYSIMTNIQSMGININETLTNLKNSIIAFGDINVDMLETSINKLSAIGWSLLTASLSFRMASKFGPIISGLADGISSLVDSADKLKSIDAKLFMNNVNAIAPIGIKLSEVAAGFNEGAQKIGVAALAFGSGILALADGADKLSNINMNDFYASVSVLRPMGVLLSEASTEFYNGAYQVGSSAEKFGDGIIALADGANAMNDVDMAKFATKISWLKPIGSHLELAADSFEYGVYNISGPAAELVPVMNNISKAFTSVNDIQFVTVTSQLVQASKQLGDVVMPLSDAIDGLSPLSDDLLTLSDGINKASSSLYSAGNNIISATNSMSQSAQPLSQFAAIISTTAETMRSTGESLLLSTEIIRLSANNLVISAQSFTTASKILSDNAYIMIDSVGGMSVVAFEMSNNINELVNALYGLSDISFDGISIATVDGLADINALSDGLYVASDRLYSAVVRFKAPADILSDSFFVISDAFNSIDSIGVNISDKIDQMAISIQSSAGRLVTIASIVNSAIIGASNTLRSTISEANDSIQAQTIPTVIVMNKTEGSRNVNKSDMLLEQQNQLLAKVVDIIGSMSNKDITKVINDAVNGAADKIIVNSGNNGDSGSMINQWIRG